MKLVFKSVTNFWSGKFCPLIAEIKQIMRNIAMKIIFPTEVRNIRRSHSLCKSLRWHLMLVFGLTHQCFIGLATLCAFLLLLGNSWYSRLVFGLTHQCFLRLVKIFAFMSPWHLLPCTTLWSALLKLEMLGGTVVIR